MKGHPIPIIACLQLLLAFVLTAGCATIFRPCIHEDGSFGSCHWAGCVLVALGTVLVLQAFAQLLLRSDETRLGLALASLPVAVMTLLVPGTLVDLCCVETMRCLSVMRPAALLTGGLLVITLAAECAILSRRLRR